MSLDEERRLGYNSMGGGRELGDDIVVPHDPRASQPVLHQLARGVQKSEAEKEETKLHRLAAAVVMGKVLSEKASSCGGTS
jgi:hypothetical protein